MGVIFLIGLAALALSLYDFFSTRDTNRLSAKVAAEKNQRYGAYEMHRSYSVVLTFIVLAFLVFSGAYIGFERGFGFSSNREAPEEREKVDSFMLTINAPPLEHIETLPPSYKLSGKDGSGTPSEASVQQPEPPAKEQAAPKPEKINDNATPADPVKSAPKPPKKTKSKAMTIEEQIREEERKMFEEAGGEAKRAEIRRKAEEDRKKREEEQKKRNAQQQTKQSNQNDGGNNGAKGKTMVSFKLDGRTPHNNDFNNIRNPGYTCMQGASGEVVLKVRVNSSGNVTSAVPSGNTGNLNPDCVEQARQYALKSRFNAASSAVQEGTITYRFVP